MIYINKITYTKPVNERREYPYNVPSILYMNELKFHKDVTFIVGENGSGKSTLIEAIAVNAGFNPEGGTRNFNFYTKKSHSELFNDIKLIRSAYRNTDGFFFRSESYYNFASNVDALRENDFGKDIYLSYGGKSLHDQSHGESFLSMLLNRLGGNGLYIFDEPESALSINSLLMMLIKIKELVYKKSQLIISTHSPILLAYPGAAIYSVTNNGLQLIRYEDTEQYIMTKYFINNYPRMLTELGLV